MASVSRRNFVDWITDDDGNAYTEEHFTEELIMQAYRIGSRGVPCRADRGPERRPPPPLTRSAIADENSADQQDEENVYSA